ncbi:MAG: hypothetical protein ACREX6_12090, partial [Casimicrobiaceae bacterium]
MPLALRLPPLAPRAPRGLELRPSRVATWLGQVASGDAVDAARITGEALALTNRAPLGASRRLELCEQYWRTAAILWPRLEQQMGGAAHPLAGSDLDAARTSLTLASELSIAYKRLLLGEASRRFTLGGPRRTVALIRRTFQATLRVLINSYLSYAPVPARTWFDAHEVYMYSRTRRIHRHAVAVDQPDATLERLYLQSLLLALANPYGFLPSQLESVLQYLQQHAQLARLTPVPPVHRMAKAVAIVPVGHDFPPFSANKGGATDGSRLYLLTFDLAFELQEEIREFETGSRRQMAGSDPQSREQHVALLKRLLRQWAIPPARQFNRLPSRARVVMCAGLSGVWQYSRRLVTGGRGTAQAPPPMTECQVINHTDGGYA